MGEKLGQQRLGLQGFLQVKPVYGPQRHHLLPRVSKIAHIHPRAAQSTPTQLLKETQDMLQSYSAELQGNQLRWLDAAPPHFLPPQKVLVVMESAAPVDPAPHVEPDAGDGPKPRYPLRDLAGRLQWAGDAVQAQRAQRDAW